MFAARKDAEIGLAQCRGPRDAQARIVVGRVRKAVRNLLIEWIPPGSSDDPRAYSLAELEIDGIGSILADPQKTFELRSSAKIPRRRADKARIDTVARLIAKQNSDHDASVWRRDLIEWLKGVQTIPPEKVRVLCETVGASWLEELQRLGYFQHLICFVAWLLDRDRVHAATVVGAATFNAWARASDLEVAWLHDGCRRAVRSIERRVDPDHRCIILGRVDVAAISQYELRAAFRVCDAADAQLLKGGLAAYPAAAVRKAASQLVSDALADKLGVDDPFAPPTLHRIFKLEEEASP